MVKKWFAILTVLSLIFVAACGGSPSNDTAGSSANNQEETSDTGSSEPKSEETIQIRLGHNMPTGSSVHEGALRFKELVEQNSNGQLSVQIFPSQQLGAMREQAESVQFGSAEMTIQPISVLTLFVPDLQIISFPYLWPSEDVMWEVLDGEAGQALLSTAENQGFKGLGVWAEGFKAMTANKKIESPEDLKGVKMRVIPSDLLINQYKAWGANPTPIDFAELYNALQQKVVDGQENPLETIYLNKYYEVQDYLTIAEHGYLAYMFTVNKDWFDGLSPELQEVVIHAEKEARQLQREKAAQSNEEILQKLKDEGMTVTVLSEEQKAQLKELVLPIHETFTKTDQQKQLLEDIYEAIEQAQ